MTYETLYETLQEAYAAVCKERDALKAKLHESRQEWIPVNKIVPPAGVDILIYSKEGGRAEGQYTGNGDFIQYRWSTIVKATHWMLLPAKPKEDEQ